MSNIDPHIRFVLVRPSHPGNIGATARAMRTMGLSRLHLIQPKRFPDDQAIAMAAGADDVLAGAMLHSNLREALAPCTLALGLSARRRGVTLEELDPRQAAQRIAAECARAGQVAVVFGNERTGLENDELARCHAMVRIPSVDSFSSLNLAQAVQVMAYELRMAGHLNVEPVPSRQPVASLEQLEVFFEHLWRTLEVINFHKGRAPQVIERRLRRFFLRAAPDWQELQILHGLLAASERVAARPLPGSEHGLHGAEEDVTATGKHSDGQQ